MQADPRFTRATLVLLPLTQAFGKRGGDVEAVLARQNIPMQALSDPKILVEATACYAVMEDMARVLDDPYFGASVAAAAARTGAPAIREAAASATTLGDFLSRIVVEIAKQVDNVRYLFSATSKTACFEVQRMVEVPGPTTQLDAIGVVFYVSLVKFGLGATYDPKRVIVTAPTDAGIPPDLLHKGTFFRSDINGLRISFPPEWLAEPFVVNWQIENDERGEFVENEARAPTLSYFESILMECLGREDISLTRFAEICRIHPRRLQRILASHGTSYRQIKDDARRALAIWLVSNTDSPIADIALQVGLSGAPAFNRAFRTWTGQTPTRFRTQNAHRIASAAHTRSS